MTNIEIGKLNNLFIEAWNNHNADGMLALLDDDVEYRVSYAMGTYKGKEAIVNLIQQWVTAFPDLMYKAHNRMIADDMIFTEYEFTGTHRGELSMFPELSELEPTNWKVTYYGAYKLTCKNNKITEIVNYPDRFALFDQLGLLHNIDHVSYNANLASI
jgi:steroid delta-isomerase-like uncharacterized protein